MDFTVTVYTCITPYLILLLNGSERGEKKKWQDKKKDTQNDVGSKGPYH